ncbi:putative lipoprotein [Azospirillaceae bacterium]
MPQCNPILTLTKTASGIIAAGRCVTFSGAQASVQGAKTLGVASTSADVEDDLAVVVSGTATVESGAAFAVGDALTSDAQGRAITATGAEFVFADALEASSRAGAKIEALLRR